MKVVSQFCRIMSKKTISSAYKLPSEALQQLYEIMQYNDSCANVNKRVTREDTLLLLKQYGWSGSVHSLNRLFKANFGRSFTGNRESLNG